MTDLLYLRDAGLLEFEAVVTDADVDRYAVALDRTAFYPTGGGQPHDTGAIDGIGVTDVRKAVDRVWHLLDPDGGRPLPAVGDTVHGTVDHERRHQLMRTHSALHVLCGVIWNEWGVPVTGGNMEPLSARMDFEFDPLPEGFAARVEELVNAEIAADRPIEVSFLPRDSALEDADLIRTKVNLIPEAVEEIRVVDIVGLDKQADGGTHVRSTGEIGRFVVTKTESKGKGNKRLRITIEDGDLMPGVHEPLTEQLLDGAFPAADPHPLFARLRTEAPVAWCDDPGFWSVSRMADVLAVATDTTTFCSSRGILLMEIGTTYDSPPTMMHTDPPEHTAYRALVSPPLRKRVVEQMQTAVRDRAVTLVEALPLGEPVDVVAELAVPFPLLVISDLLGLEDVDLDRLYQWSEAVIPGAADMTPEQSMELATEMTVYLMDEAGRRRERPGDDLITTVALAELDGRRLDDAEVAMFLIQLLVAGNETTRNMISGGLVAFAQHPDEWSRLRADRSLVPTAVEELLRWTSPVSSFMRTATVDTTLGGVDIAAGDHVLLLYGSADRDEAAFGDTAGTLDVGRSPNHHVAFGFGAHFCLGAALARLEAQVLLDLLLDRVAGVQLAGEIVPSPSNVIAGVRRAPLVLQPA